MNFISRATFFVFIQGVLAKCPFPGAPAHSRVVFSEDTWGTGTVASYECEAGFELLGPARRICGSDRRWTPEGIPFCVLNVAAGKASMQVSTEGGGSPQRALDGSTTSRFTTSTCSLTKQERLPWWYVNLLEPHMVQLVRVDFGKPCCNGTKPAVVEVRVGYNRPEAGTNPICNRFTGFLDEGKPLFLPCNPPMPGAFVSIHLEAASLSQLSICEVFVYTDQALPIERCPQFRDQPPGSIATYNGKCYTFYHTRPMAFGEAAEFCRSRGGSLVSESNPALQGFISWELWRRHRSDSNSQYWMGAVRDINDPLNWKWLTGEDVAISFWSDTDGEENCVHFDGSRGWLWTKTACEKSLNFICQHQPKSCGSPEQPPNSTITADSFAVGTSVEYSCDDGHLLVGPAVRTCLNTGFYDEFAPVCKRIECGFPAEIVNGQYKLINNSVTYLSQVQYSCDDGHEMTGRARLVCDIDERWNGPPPRCDVVKCEPPPQIPNGRVKLSRSESEYGATAEYACARGFILNGASRIECLATGLWDKPAPHCAPQERPTSTTAVLPTKPATTVSPPSTPRPSTARPHPPSSPTPFVAPDRGYRTKPTTARPTTHVNERTTTKPKKQEHQTTVSDTQESPTSYVPHIIVANHPREHQIVGSGNNIRIEELPPRVNEPHAVDGSPTIVRESSSGSGLLGIIAIGACFVLVFVGLVVVAACCICRKQKRKDKSWQEVSADCNTVASADSSLSESRSGLNRCYRQAWEELHEGNQHVSRRQNRGDSKDRLQELHEVNFRSPRWEELQANQHVPRRQDRGGSKERSQELLEVNLLSPRRLDRSQELNLFSPSRLDRSQEIQEVHQIKPRRQDREAPRDGPELVVLDVYPQDHAAHSDKKKHHHHHNSVPTPNSRYHTFVHVDSTPVQQRSRRNPKKKQNLFSHLNYS